MINKPKSIVKFTMNPAGDDFKDRGSTSPALFNRCVINWFGTWPEAALFQVARVFTDKLDLAAGNPKYAPGNDQVHFLTCSCFGAIIHFI